MASQMSTFDGEKNAYNWEKYDDRHVKYHIILGNLVEYGYQGIDPGSKVQYLLNGIRCDKLSTAVTTIRAHADNHLFLTQYIDESTNTKCEGCLSCPEKT